MSKGRLEQELQKIHEAGIGVSITWLWDGTVDVRLVHKTGIVAAEGNVNAVAHVVAWLESTTETHFPEANCEYTSEAEIAHDAFSSLRVLREMQPDINRTYPVRTELASTPASSS